jgi:hypothetical protein
MRPITNMLAGGAFLFAAMLVPVLHHGILSLAATNDDRRSYSFDSLSSHFFDLPFVDFIYLIVMSLVGIVLLRRGLSDTR